MDWVGNEMNSLKIEQKIVYKCIDLYVKMRLYNEEQL